MAGVAPRVAVAPTDELLMSDDCKDLHVTNKMGPRNDDSYKVHKYLTDDLFSES